MRKICLWVSSRALQFTIPNRYFPLFAAFAHEEVIKLLMTAIPMPIGAGIKPFVPAYAAK